MYSLGNVDSTDLSRLSYNDSTREVHHEHVLGTENVPQLHTARSAGLTSSHPKGVINISI
jgi:hypothetical protein